MAAADVPTAPFRLRVEHADSPHAVQNQRPRFAWAVALHYARGVMATSYDIQVNQTDSCTGLSTQIWSAHITSAPPVQFGSGSANPLPLLSGTNYTWRVRWTNSFDNQTSPWALSSFSTAFFNEADWKGAVWLGMDGPSSVAPFKDVDTANLFRSSLALPTSRRITRCVWALSGLGYHHAYVNGQRLNDYELGESTQFERRIPYDVADITWAVTTGNNNITLAVELGRGWYGEQQIHALGNVPSGPRMLRSLVILYLEGDEAPHYYPSGPRFPWRRGAGPIIDDELHLGIVYDARREVPGWQTPGFDDTHWELITSAVNLSQTKLWNASMTTTVHPPIRKIRSFAPKTVKTVATNMWTVDLGENFAGWCRYKFPSPPPAGSNVTFLHAERVNLNNGSITHDIQPLTQGAYENSVYIFGNSSSNAVFEPRFISYASRYVQLTGPLHQPPKISDIECWQIGTNLDPAGKFNFSSTGNTTITDLQSKLMATYDATARSAAANWISYPTDCPHRERRGWLGDAQAAAETLMSLFDLSAGNSKWLTDVRDAADVMYNNGDFPTLAPNYAKHPPTPNAGKTAIAWSSAFVLVWDWTWRRYADLSLAEQHYDRAREYLDRLYEITDPKTHTIHANWGGGMLGDWCAALGVNNTGPTGSQFGPRHVSGVFNTFYFIQTHQAFLRAHTALKKPENESIVYKTRLQNALSGMNFAFYDRVHDIYRDPDVAANAAKYGAEPLQTSLALALMSGSPALPHVNGTARVWKSLLHEVYSEGSRLTTGLIGTKYLLPMLSEQDRQFDAANPTAGVDMAIAIAAQTEDPSWGYMIDQGPGTVWESWDGNASWHRERGSLNHIMLGSQLHWYYSHLGGIRLPDDSIGWSTVQIYPKVTKKLSGVEASLMTVRGEIASNWEWVGVKQYMVNVSIPVGTAANISFGQASSINESNITIYSNASGFAHKFPQGISQGIIEFDGSVIFIVFSGSFKFSITL